MERFTFVIQDASSLYIFKKNLNELCLAMSNSFVVNNPCIWCLACACVSCQIFCVLNYLCNLSRL